MFKIFAMICMLNVGELDQTLCFKSEVPLNFNDNIECNLAKNNLANYLDADLKERRARWEEGLEKDIYLFEAVNVLEDLILPANKTHKLAQIKE